MGKSIAIALVIISTLLFAGCGNSVDKKGSEKAIRGIMAEQESAWNSGDIPAFMQGYWKSDSLKFIGSSVQLGWQNTLDNYKKSYPTQDNMGKLTFDLLEVDVLSNESAFVLGKWHLDRKLMADAEGHFTLLWKRINGKWRIVTDHSS